MLVMSWAISNSIWLIDKGNNSFWMDKSMGDGIIHNIFGHLPESDLSAKVVDVYFNKDIVKGQVVGDADEVPTMWHVLQDLHVDPQGDKDKLIWTPSLDGNFSIKSTWKVINIMRSVISSKKWIWSILIP